MPCRGLSEDQVLGLASRCDVASGFVGPVEGSALVDRFTVSSDRDRPDGAQENEPLQIRPYCYVEDTAESLDVGLEKRCGVSQFGSGVDDAVADNVAVWRLRCRWHP
jgi:hypothetical protein